MAAAPAVAVPETLTLPIAAIVDIGRRGAIVAVAGTIIAGAVAIAGAVITRAGQRAADKGTANEAPGDRRADAALGMRRLGCHDGRQGQGGNRREGDQCLLHGLTFLISREDTTTKQIALVQGESFTSELNDQ